MESATRPGAPPQLEVRVHCFSWCSCGSETYSADHIKLKTFKRPVEPGQAVALSYSFGDFDRQKHLFGHVDGVESEAVRLEFGGEWEIEGLKGALVALSEKHGAVWLDQLSIPQDPTSITSHLQNMPQIYRGFEVVVLLPTAPCPCLQVAFDSWTPEGPHATETGDFNIYDVPGECLNAFPVSSYNFRLWTKQEFTFARTISIHYCGAPGKCLRGAHFQGFEKLDTLLKGSRHLSRWASWKYDSCAKMASDQNEHAQVMRYSAFGVAHVDGIHHLFRAVLAFFTRQDTPKGSWAERMRAHSASFLLGKRLHRDPHRLESRFMAFDLHSEHVATWQKDLALAVLPAADGYRLPQGHAEMTLPELIDDGIEQCQRYMYNQASFKTKLPRGLFEDGTSSMSPKPSLHLRTENIRCLRDVYGSLLPTSFPRIEHPRDPWVAPLHLRDVPARPSRLTLSRTYAEAFGRASTAEVRDFMGQLLLSGGFTWHSRVKAYREWVFNTYSGEITAPVASWPSSAHEQAIFEHSLRPDRTWRSSWPEIDHERVCYNIMCDYVCIHPDVAREKGLGLVVKTSDPPCIGFVNRVVYGKMRATELYQHRHGSSAPELWRRDHGIAPEDWLTITLDDDTEEIHQTLEVVRINTRRGLPEHPVNDFVSRHKKSLPRYVVRGVWYECLGDDACIGAELRKYRDGFDALLI